MPKRVFMLMGPQIGRPISDVADADAAIAVTDGWGREITPTAAYPFDSSGQLPKAAWPTSLRNWLTKIYGGTDVSYPNSLALACLSISKANPTVITLSAADAAKIANGNTVIFRDTTVAALDNAGVLTTANKTGNTFTVPVDLLAIPATVTNKGIVTKLIP
jgi:hypothetical protein